MRPVLGGIGPELTHKLPNRPVHHLKDNEPDSTQAGLGNQYAEWHADTCLNERTT